ncbi:hypothetical protein [Anaeromusa acidaminophila]|uniref:hypothetical protein n=1 Tax=Anaeromusa acidaminophila TaxID=81464 RepID=UPI0012E9C6E6|nr:hypothetical protein [Anaeromusa acidaminophila]
MGKRSAACAESCYNPGMNFLVRPKERYLSCDYCQHFVPPIADAQGNLSAKAVFYCTALKISFFEKNAYRFNEYGTREIPSLCQGHYRRK